MKSDCVIYLPRFIKGILPALLLALIVFPFQAPHGQVEPGDGSYSAELTKIQTYSQGVLGMDLWSQGAGPSQGVDVRMTISRDSTSPFVATHLDGKRVWLASSTAFALDIDCPDYDSVHRSKYDVSVLVDSVTGKLLKIVMRSELFDPSVIRKPHATSADTQLEAAQKCEGLPADAPKVSLVDALSRLPSCPLYATEIVAFYTLRKHPKFRDREAHPAWDIFLYGSKWFGLRARGDEPIYMRNYIRYLVDATTGQWLIGSNIPAPERERQDDPSR